MRLSALRGLSVRDWIIATSGALVIVVVVMLFLSGPKIIRRVGSGSWPANPLK